jgi:Uma2 family endonuclease
MEDELQEPAFKYNYVSPKEYLEAERNAIEKHELHEGHIVTLTGASRNHNRIVRNLSTSIDTFLNDSECEVFPSDLRTYIPIVESFTYPDLSIVCNETDILDDEYQDTLLNPSVLIEVLSPSTSKHDKGKKFFYYTQILCLKEYILVDSTSCYVQIARRQPGGSWKFEETTDIHASLFIETIGHEIPLEKIYRRVKFRNNENKL